MSCKEKCKLLSEILTPFGYCYNSRWDAISTYNEVWQREAGYTALFDKAALHLHMVFDALPVYFDYDGRTWLIELWKGQYGINTGAEVGIYCADKILTEKERGSAHFQAVSDNRLLSVTFTLFRGNQLIGEMTKRTWWLTIFFVGLFSTPSQLSMDVAVRFPDFHMQQAFLNALKDMGISSDFFYSSGPAVHLSYMDGCPLSPVCPENSSCFRRLRIRQINFSNRFFCVLYRFMTRPFHCTMDRILYLYYLLPFAFRRILRHLKGVHKK